MANFLMAISQYPDWKEMLSFSLLGFGTVCFVIMSVSAVTAFIGMFFGGRKES